MISNALNESKARPDGYAAGSVYSSQNNRPFFEINEICITDENELPVHKRAGEKLHTIIWIKEGCGQLLIDLQWNPFQDNTIFYLEPGQLHRFESHAKVVGYCISFSASVLDMSEMFIGLTAARACSQHRFFKTVLCSNDINNALEELVQAMIKECTNCFLLGPEVLRGLLGIFMVHLARDGNVNTDHRGTNHDEQLAKRFMHLLNEKVCARRTVSDYAGELAISPNYLNQVMKRHTGFTASHHIQQYTILEAKRRLLFYQTTLKEIAYYLGFDDLAHFSKFFKKNAGTSFREFKNQIAGC